MQNNSWSVLCQRLTDDGSVCSLGVTDSQLETSSVFSLYFSIWCTFGGNSAHCDYFPTFCKRQSLLSFQQVVDH